MQCIAVWGLPIKPFSFDFTHWKISIGGWAKMFSESRFSFTYSSNFNLIEQKFQISNRFPCHLELDSHCAHLSFVHLSEHLQPRTKVGRPEGIHQHRIWRVIEVVELQSFCWLRLTKSTSPYFTILPKLCFGSFQQEKWAPEPGANVVTGAPTRPGDCGHILPTYQKLRHVPASQHSTS